MENGRCPKGQYYCYTNKECKPIPNGFMVDPEGMLRKENGATVDEANKSGDSSLRDWFSKSKSSDGKPGWVQLGGKYAGKPCAKQPGQTTKPKCGSSKMKRNLSKDEEERAFRRKNRKDPNPDRKGKAINVATEETKKDHEYSMARSELKTVRNAAKRLEKKMGKKGEGELKAWVQSKITKAADYIDTAADYVTNEAAGEKDACYHKVKSRYKVWPSAYASGALVKCRKKGAANWGNSTKKEEFELSNWRDDFVPTDYETVDLIKPEPLQATDGIGSRMLDEKCWKGYEKKGMKTMFGKRYPNCVKKEETEVTQEQVTMSPQEVQLQRKKAIIDKMIAQKRQQQLAKSKKEIETPEKALGEEMKCSHTSKGMDCPVHGKSACDAPRGGNGGKLGPNKNYVKPMGESMEEAVRLPSKTGNIIMVHLSWRGKYYGIKMFFPSIKTPSRKEVQEQIDKVYPGAKIHTYKVSDYNPGEPLLQTEDWQKVNKSDKTDGMSAAAVKAYRRENPGSKLKTAVTGDPKPGSKDAKRRKSFCARSKGQQDMHNIDCSKTPDKPVCKARRRWKC